jgi:phage terminase large subunit GpA-like protein
VRAEERLEERKEWLASQFDGLTTDITVSTPSEWAERVRYLPPSNTSLPGFYRFDVTPYLREIVDCFATESTVREIAVMKGVQVGATTGVLENVIGYLIDEVRTAPAMMLTADADLANLRMTTNVIPMVQSSGLSSLIRSSDENNHRKTGQTDKKIEWVGGGFLIPFGAQNANKLRSIPIRYLLRDEVDGYPALVGKDGDPIKLSTDRTAAYEESRKILDISTPTIKGQSNIEKAFKRGDQRYYLVRCLGCERHQVLRWKHKPDPETGIIGGMIWETSPDGHVVPGSVRYLCQFCGHAHTNEDKTRLFDPAHGAEWQATKVPVHPSVRSYHISALYSPPGQQTWEACVRKFLEAWDVENDRPRSTEELQVFYNNVLGEVYELRGAKLKYEQLSPHKRQAYKFGEVPNRWALEHAGSRIQLLTAAVDVHAENLKVAVWGWTIERRAFLIDYFTFEGNTELVDDPGTWGELHKLIEKVYSSDDGISYPLSLTLIDSGYRDDQVHQFCAEYEGGVAAVKGMPTPKGAAGAVKHFTEFRPPLGERAFGIYVDFYKERWSVALKRGWSGLGVQPPGHFNAPHDVTEKQLKELTVEVKVEKIDPQTKERVGVEWRRPSGSRNELWDLLVYGSAALDLLAWEYCRNELELEQVIWPDFWAFCETGAYQT